MTNTVDTNPVAPSPAATNTAATAPLSTAHAGTRPAPTPRVVIHHTAYPLLMDYIINSLSFEGRLRFRGTSRQYHTRLTPTICPVVVSVDGHEGPNGESSDIHHEESPRPLFGSLPHAFANVNLYDIPARRSRRHWQWPMEPTVHTVLRSGNVACTDRLHILSKVTHVVDFADLVRPRTQHEMYTYQRYVMPKSARSYIFHSKWRHDTSENSGHRQGVEFEQAHNILEWTLVLHPVDPVVPGPTGEEVQNTWSTDEISADSWPSAEEDEEGNSDEEYDSDGPGTHSSYGYASALDVPKFIRPFMDAFTKGNPHASLTVVGAERVHAERLGADWFDVKDLILNTVYFTAGPIRSFKFDWAKSITFKTFDEWHGKLSAMDKICTEWPTTNSKYKCTRCHEVSLFGATEADGTGGGG